MTSPRTPLSDGWLWVEIRPRWLFIGSTDYTTEGRVRLGIAQLAAGLGEEVDL